MHVLFYSHRKQKQIQFHPRILHALTSTISLQLYLGDFTIYGPNFIKLHFVELITFTALLMATSSTSQMASSSSSTSTTGPTSGATNTTSLFEVSFAKAMKLLQSQSKDSAEQLKAILDECLAQKKATPAMVPKQPVPMVKPVITNKAPIAVPKPIIIPSDDNDCASLSCVVCKQVEQSAGNEIVECQECHSLYHQECHKPSLANENVKDPRFVWYCSTCTNKRKKAKLPGKPIVSSAGNGAATKDTKEHQNPELSPFKSWSFLKK